MILGILWLLCLLLVVVCLGCFFTLNFILGVLISFGLVFLLVLLLIVRLLLSWVCYMVFSVVYCLDFDLLLVRAVGNLVTGLLCVLVSGFRLWCWFVFNCFNWVFAELLYATFCFVGFIAVFGFDWYWFNSGGLECLLALMIIVWLLFGLTTLRLFCWVTFWCLLLCCLDIWFVDFCDFLCLGICGFIVSSLADFAGFGNFVLFYFW